MQFKFRPTSNKPLGRLRSWVSFLLFWGALFVMPFSAQATHIVGGEIGYRCLGNNRYEITLRVFRDCYYGDALAPFDDPASIGVFDRDGKLVQNILVARMGDDTLTNVIDHCIINSGNVCVHTTTYKAIAVLSPRAGGYRFVYQRCCRNETVRNIVKPLETGATFDILLTEAAMARCNNSPVFNAWPPIFICRNEPLVFNHSAIDTDGDSLVYKLIVPQQGGTILFPTPIPPDPPPYDTVVWNNPPGQSIYSIDNMLGFGKPLVLDPITGLMTATPGELGQYVIGISIQEYDRVTKVLLSETKRDFQYNVIDCERVTAAIFAPQTQCDNLTVSFTNKSTNGLNGDVFEWYFDTPGGGLGSTEKNPVFTFPDTGRYVVTLIAEPNTLCADTARHEIFLQYNSLIVDFETKVVDCFGSTFIQLRNTSRDTISPIIKWEWVLSLEDGTVRTSSAASPEFEVATGLKGTIRLTATSKNGCIQTVERALVTGENKPSNYLTSTRIEACLGQIIGLNAGTSPDVAYGYRWSPAAGLSDTTAVNPLVVVTGNASYSVTITPANGLCDTVIRVDVLAVEQTPAAFSSALQCDGYTVAFTNTTPGNTPGQWIIGDPTNPLLDTTAMVFEYTFATAGDYPVQLITINNCPDTLTKSVRVTGDFLEPKFTFALKGCSASDNQLQFTDASTNLFGNTNSWQWMLGDGQGASLQHPVFSFKDGVDSVTVKLIIGTAQGCSDTLVQLASVRFTDFAAVAPDAALLVCPAVPTALNERGSSGYRYLWTPATSLSATNIPNPIVQTKVDITYQVQISDISGVCDTLVTVAVKVADFKSEAPPAVIVVCPDIPTPLHSKGSSAYRYTWTPATGLSATNIPNPTVTTNTSQTYQVRISDPLNNCDTTVTVAVQVVDFTSVGPASVVLACPGIPTPINPKGNAAYAYSWLPATGLSSTTSPNPLVTTDTAITYLVRVSDLLDNCGALLSVRVELTDFASVAPDADLLVCAGNPTPINPAGSGPYLYSWTPATGLSATNIPNPTVTIAADQVYQVRISDPLNLCDTTITVRVRLTNFAGVIPPSSVETCPDLPIALNPGGDSSYVYTWSPATGLSATHIVNPTATVNQTTTYMVRISDPAGLCDTTVSVLVRMYDFASVGPDTGLVICKGAATPINPRGNARFTYSWAPATGLSATNIPNPSATLQSDMVYTVTITDPTGNCDTTMTIRVMLAPSLQTDAGRDTALCATGAFTLMGQSNGATRLEWSDQASFSAILGQGDTLNVNLSRGSKTYYLRSTSILGCLEIDSINVQVFPLLATLPATAQACLPSDMLDLTVTNGDTAQQLRYSWSPAALFISDPNGGPEAIIKAQDKTTVQVVVTNQYGCTQTLSTAVSVLNLPGILSIEVDKNPIRAGEQSVITVKGCTDCTYSWTPSNGLNTTSGSTVTAKPEETTTYIVTVQKAGCTDTLSATIVVKQCVEPFLPNAFTPNGDGINDVLYVRVKDYEALQLIIYNRWGQEVFDTRNPDIGWNGSFRGRQLPPDVYGFYLYMKCPDGTEYTKKGNISLIR